MPEEKEEVQSNTHDDSHNMLVSLPSATHTLQRTQAALGLLREVIQESSAEYWYERGKKARAVEEWNEAVYCYHKCRETPGDTMRIEALICLVEVLEIRAERKAHNGDFEGSYWDKRSAESECEELAYWEDCAADYWDGK